MTPASSYPSADTSYFSFVRRAQAIPELDGLRAIAVILVLARHIFRPIQEAQPDWLIALGYDFSIPLVNGWVGVDLFFILSGFLISRHLIERTRRGDSQRVGSYLTARVLRIVPAYLAVMVLVIVGAFPFFQPEIAMGSVLVHLLFLQDYLGADIVVAFWSLGVEEKFYILAPFIVCLAAKSISWGRYWLLILLVFMPLMLRTGAMISGTQADSYAALFMNYRSPFHLTFDGLAIGMLIAFIQVDGMRASERLRRIILTLSLAVIAMLMGSAPMMATITAFDMTVQPLLIAAAFGGITWAMLNRPAERESWLSARWMFVTAQLSYTLYLVHMPLIPFAMMLSMLGTGAMNPVIFAIAVLGLSVLAALVLHFAVEKPFLILKEGRKVTS
jgi:peptidoglycan/LPS O-acetylase OafA/YrhL